METSECVKVLTPEVRDTLLTDGYPLADVERELSLETPATWLDIRAFKLRHPIKKKT